MIDNWMVEKVVTNWEIKVIQAWWQSENRLDGWEIKVIQGKGEQVTYIMERDGEESPMCDVTRVNAVIYHWDGHWVMWQVCMQPYILKSSEDRQLGDDTESQGTKQESLVISLVHGMQVNWNRRGWWSRYWDAGNEAGEVGDKPCAWYASQLKREKRLVIIIWCITAHLMHHSDIEWQGMKQ